MPEITLTTYQHRCLRSAMEQYRYLMLAHEPALRRLTELGLVVTIDRCFGAEWIAPTEAGFAWLYRHPRHNSYPGVVR